LKPRICAVITDKDLGAIKKVEPLVERFEVRIDLIGDDWQKVVQELSKPWIACNRLFLKEAIGSRARLGEKKSS